MKLKIATACAFALFLAACGQNEPVPVALNPEPIYDKYGTPSCAPGYVVATSASGQTVCSPVDG
ncbi:hypothetical protein ACFORG_12380 [Lutimaribacter marinistellae]|uniref:Lipoprotein n=1 Tax=Lutimaribacter marinistellae TaxID=1820329 RepID=A0ABV7TG24_9RHOB